MKKILVDIYLALNIGDDMFLDHLAKSFPDTQFVPFHPGNNYNFFFNNYPNVSKLPYSLKDKILKNLKLYNKLEDYSSLATEYDGLLFLGGGIFREEPYWRKLYDYRKNITNAFKEKNKPVGFLGCNFGPFQSAEFLNKHKDLFDDCSSVCFRDKASFQLFKENGCVTVAPDILWSYPVPHVITKDKTLGISVIDPNHKKNLEKYYNEYVEQHRKVCDSYLSKGYKVVLFSFCKKEGDLEIAKKIAAPFKNNVEIVNYEGNIEEYLKRFGECSEFIAARFHANILAMLYNKPVLPIIYGDKTKNLLSDIGFDNEIIEFDNLKSISKADIGSNYNFPIIDDTILLSEKALLNNTNFS